MNTGNLFAATSESFPAELIEVLSQNDSVRIERIVSKGHTSPSGVWYDQEFAEWVALISGKARIEFADGKVREIVPGAWLEIPPHCRHRVEWTDPEVETIWLAVHYAVEHHQ